MRPGAAAASGGTVAFAWEHEPGVSKLLQSATTTTTKPAPPPPPAAEEEEDGERAAPPVARTKQAAAHRIRVRPPPGAPWRGRRGGAVVRPEEDPFLAAFLACTERGRKKAPHKLLGLGLGLGLSCKGPGDVVQSVVRLAKMPHSLNDDD